MDAECKPRGLLAGERDQVLEESLCTVTRTVWGKLSRGVWLHANTWRGVKFLTLLCVPPCELFGRIGLALFYNQNVFHLSVL